MRKIRANAIAILTVAWILGTFYYLWQDNRAHAASSGGRGAQRAGGRSEQLREDRTIPLIVSTLCAPGERRLAFCPRAVSPGRGARPGAACPESRSGFVYVREFLPVVMATCAGPEGPGCLDAGRVTACGGREKVLQVWWARRARAIGNVAALAAPRCRGWGLGGCGLLAIPRGRLALECSERVVGAERSKSA